MSSATAKATAFDAPFNEGLVSQAVIKYQACGRQATKKQKTRSEVRGGGKKPWSQKGGGRARHGSRRSPIWRGGGLPFAARTNRNYKLDLPRKMYRAAMASILAELDRRGYIQVVDAITLADHKTKTFVDWMGQQKEPASLILVDEMDEKLMLAARNVKGVTVMLASHVDPYSLANTDSVIITKAALKQLEERFA